MSLVDSKHRCHQWGFKRVIQTRDFEFEPHKALITDFMPLKNKDLLVVSNKISDMLLVIDSPLGIIP